MRPRLALLIVLLLAPFAAPVLAQPAQPLDRLLPEVRRNLPGQFLDAEPGPNDGSSPSYRLKWLTPDGRVIWRDVDARTGRVMRQPPERGFSGRDDNAARFFTRGIEQSRITSRSDENDIYRRREFFRLNDRRSGRQFSRQYQLAFIENAEPIRIAVRRETKLQ